ncbi:MAG: hypothetical protein FRX48_04687 [Lasallia pustulata]|uniref:Uncharacterized protein n=1 Tax=Lasallia pustulata TaxID=136370 RepID=A0A5M8PR05_9LECA|nr:MAG: hypothetical protein FRX48_04687 [Lasallia pustulata]
MLIPIPSLTLCLIVIASSLPTLISSTPVPISPRSPVLSTTPQTEASTEPTAHTNNPDPAAGPSPPLLSPRSDTVWGVPGTQTSLSLHFTATVIPPAILPVLNDAYNSVYAHLHTAGDGLLPGGNFDFADHLMVVKVWNSNNHQITWGVLGSALWGLRDFMQEKGVWGVVVFQVLDGSSWVGSGMVGWRKRWDS